MKSEVSGIFLTIFWSISYSSDTCVYVSGEAENSNTIPFLILKSTNGSIREVPFGNGTNPQDNISCTISTQLLPADFCATSPLFTKSSAALHPSFVVTTSLNAQTSSISTQRGNDQLNETLYEYSFGSAFAGLVIGIIITSTVCLLREKFQKKKNREVYQQNDYVPPSQEIQMNDVYNEISNERNSKGVQQMTLTTEQRHSSMSSNISCSVYNHLHESTVDNRENHYEHVHLTKTEDPALGHFNGTLDDVPNADKDSDEGVVDDNDFLFQKENLPIPESDGLKTNDNYFVLEKSLFT